MYTASSLAGGQWQYGYDPSSGELTSIEDPAQGTLINQYYASGENAGRVQYQWDPNAVAAAGGHPSDPSTATQFAYSGYSTAPTGNPSDALTGTSTITYPDGSSGVATYSDGLLQNYVQRDSGATVAEWDFDYEHMADYSLNPLGMIDRITESQDNLPDRLLMAMTYNSQGLMTQYFAPDGQWTYSTYNTHNFVGKPDSVTQAATSAHPVTTTYTYDGPLTGNLVSVSRPWTDTTGASLGSAAVITLHHAHPSNPEDATSVTAVDGTTTQFAYDPNTGQEISTTNPSGDETTYSYDKAGHRVAMVSPSGNVSGANVAAHRSLAVTSAGGQPIIGMDAVAAGVADGFVRADSSAGLGSSPAGDPWITKSGSWSIAGDTAHGSPGVATLADSNLSATDGYTASYVVADASVDQVGVAFRVEDSSNYWDVVQVPSDGTWRLNKVIGGGSQEMARASSVTNSISVGDHLSVYSVGAGTLVYLNGALLMSSNDGMLSAYTGVGLYSGAGTSGSPAPVASGFAAGSLKGSTSHAWYDSAGRETLTAGPQLSLSGLSSTSSSYDPDGNQTAFTNANGNVTETGWDSIGRMRWQSNAVPATAPPQAVGAKTEYDYDTLGRVTKVTAPGKNPVTISYHSQFQTLSNGSQAYSSQVVTKPDGSTVTTYFDGGGYPLAIYYGSDSSADVTYSWDDFGRLVGSTLVPATGPSVVVSRSLDSLGDVLSETRNGLVTSYHYDSNLGAAGDQPGRLASINYPGSNHTVTEQYTNGRWTSTTDWNQKVTTFNWGTAADIGSDPNVVGELKNVTFPNGTSEARTFDADGLISTTAYTASLTAGQPAVTWPVTYARQQGEALTSATQLGSTSSWTYDPATQLKTQTNPSVSVGYDSNGEPTTLNGVKQVFDSSGELCWTGSGSGTCLNPPSGSVTSTYTDNGERKSTESNTYSYDPLGQMTKSVTPAGTTNYTYSADGLRVSKKTGSNPGVTTEFAWDTTSSVPQLIQDGANFYIYGPGGMPIERLSDADTRFLMIDGTGSVAASTDMTGTSVSARTYDAWGNVIAHSGPGNPVSLGWQGQYQDTETGFYYLRHRYYDPATAQFTTPDPLFPLTRSRYGYAANDPVNLTDPLGLYGYGVIADAFQWIAGGLGSLMNSIGNVYTQTVGSLARAIESNPWESVAIVASAAATVGCLAGPGGALGCAGFALVAYAARAYARIQSEGFGNSLRANEIDLVASMMFLGLGTYVEGAAEVPRPAGPGYEFVGRALYSAGPDTSLGIGDLATQGKGRE